MVHSTIDAHNSSVALAQAGVLAAQASIEPSLAASAQRRREPIDSVSISLTARRLHAGASLAQAHDSGVADQREQRAVDSVSISSEARRLAAQQRSTDQARENTRTDEPFIYRVGPQPTPITVNLSLSIAVNVTFLPAPASQPAA